MLLQETALQLPRSAFLLAADLTEQVCVRMYHPRAPQRVQASYPLIATLS